MKEARIELKVKNNILYNEIMKRASNVRQFCQKYGFSESSVGHLLCLREAPWSSRLKDNGWRRVSRRLSKLFHMLAEDLFPTDLYILEKTEAVMEVSVEALSLGHHPALMIESSEDQYMRKEAQEEVHKLMSILRPRDCEIICDRYGIGTDRVPMTYRDIGSKYKISQTRVQQIERISIRKLRRRAACTGGTEWYMY